MKLLLTVFIKVVEGFKKNEEQLKSYIEEYKNKLSRQDQKYQLLKDHAEEKLEEANKEIDNISKSQVWPIGPTLSQYGESGSINVIYRRPKLPNFPQCYRKQK